MNYFLNLCCVAMLLSSAFPVHAEHSPALQLVQTLPLPGVKDAQDALFLGGDFNKLYVSSLDGTLRMRASMLTSA